TATPAATSSTCSGGQHDHHHRRVPGPHRARHARTGPARTGPSRGPHPRPALLPHSTIRPHRRGRHRPDEGGAVTMLDLPALLRWLDERAESTRSPLVIAVYKGLADRIRRGDFDAEEVDR